MTKRGNSVADSLSLRESVLELLSTSHSTLRLYMEEPRSGFFDQYPNPVDKPHISTTAQCIRAIFRVPQLSRFVEELQQGDAWEFFATHLWESGGIPEYNVYASPLVLVAANLLGIGREASKIDQAISSIVETYHNYCLRGQDADNRVVCGHGYVVHWVVQALHVYSAALGEAEQEVLESILDYCEDQVSRHLALHYADCEAEFDAAQLCFFLRVLAKLRPMSVHRLAAKGIEIVVEAQHSNGLWELSQPFLHRAEGGEMRVFSIEVATTLLGLLPDEGITGYLGMFERVLNWILDNRIREGEPEGWRSDSHWREGPPEAWATALVYEFLGLLAHRLESAVNTVVLRTLGGRLASPHVEWDDLVGNERTRQAIERNVLEPISRQSRPLANSILLFGPPGTGKNTLVEALAYELRWPLVVLIPADFLMDGPYHLIREARDYFSRLGRIQRAVVFFDEFDEFFVSREEETEKLGRFITTAMLPWLQRLHDSRRVVAVMATNRIRRFDIAVTRPGRFDLVLPVGPPTKTEQAAFLRSQLSEFLAKDVDAVAAALDPRITISELVIFSDFIGSLRDAEKWVSIAISEISSMRKKLVINQQSFEDYRRDSEEKARFGFTAHDGG